jgi:HEAT repeat protein
LGVLVTISWSLRAAGDEPPVVTTLIEKLGHPDFTARPAVAGALGTYGAAARRAVPDLGKMLRQEKDHRSSLAAAQALARIGAPAVPELVSSLKHPAAIVRIRAAGALGMIGPDADEAVPALITALGDNDPQVRQLAAGALGEIGPKAKAAVVPLVAALRDPVAPVGQQAAVSLRRIGAAAVPALTEALKDKQPATREAAAHALSLLGPDAREAVGALAEAARDQHAGTRHQAIVALGGIGPAAKKSAPALFDALKVRDIQTQARAATALLAIDDGSDEKLAATMREITRKVRWATPPVLAQFGRRPKDAVRPLILALQDADPNQRAAAAVTLGNIGRDAREAVPALKKALTDQDIRVRLSAAGALPLIDEESRKEAVEAFDQFLTQMENRRIALWDLIRAKRAALLQAQLVQRSQAVFMTALHDPALQSYNNEVVGTFIVAMSTLPPHACQPRLNSFQELARNDLQNLGPEAAPSLVQGANIVAVTRLGFI